MLKRSCQQVVQLSVHPHWSVGALLTARKERGSERGKKKNVVDLFICPSLWQPCRRCQGRKINAGQADSHSSLFRGSESSSQDRRELKASLYDNHSGYYSHYDDDDLQMSLSGTVVVCACGRFVCTNICEHLSLWVRCSGGQSGRTPDGVNKEEQRVTY